MDELLPLRGDVGEERQPQFRRRRIGVVVDRQCGAGKEVGRRIVELPRRDIDETITTRHQVLCQRIGPTVQEDRRHHCAHFFVTLSPEHFVDALMWVRLGLKGPLM